MWCMHIIYISWTTARTMPGSTVDDRLLAAYGEFACMCKQHKIRSLEELAVYRSKCFHLEAVWRQGNRGQFHSMCLGRNARGGCVEWTIPIESQSVLTRKHLRPNKRSFPTISQKHFNGADLALATKTRVCFGLLSFNDCHWFRNPQF